MNYQEILDYYETLLKKYPAVERKGKTMPYTSMNGHMFSFLSKEGRIGLRLSKEDLSEIISRYDCSIMEQHGRVMKEYVDIPLTLLREEAEMAKYLEKSITYVSSLKPKPTKKK